MPDAIIPLIILTVSNLVALFLLHLYERDRREMMKGNAFLLNLYEKDRRARMKRDAESYITVRANGLTILQLSLDFLKRVGKVYVGNGYDIECRSNNSNN